MKFENTVYQGNPALVRFFGEPNAAVMVNAGKMKPGQAYQNFLEWLKAKFPSVYSGLAFSRPDLVHAQAIFPSVGLFGLGEGEGEVTTATEQSIFDKLLSSINQIVPTYLQYQSQQDLIKLNIERAKQGLAPIDSSLLAPSVNFGMTADTRKLVTYTIIGALGLAALAIVTSKKRSRK